MIGFPQDETEINWLKRRSMANASLRRFLASFLSLESLSSSSCFASSSAQSQLDLQTIHLYGVCLFSRCLSYS